MYPRLRKFLLLFFLILLVVSYFLKRNYKTVYNIHPEVLQSPSQSSIANTEIIKFSKDGYTYNLTPIANYQIKALVVHRMDYRFFSINNSDSVFPIDLCLVWGDNLSSKAYQDRSLSFSQDTRFCFYRWRGDLSIDPSMISNNHLITNDKKILSDINKIKTGDQVEITGYLVNVEANKIGKISDYDPSYFNLNSSTIRTDDGGGACEIIYVKDIKTLQAGHPISSFLFYLSFYAIIALMLLSIMAIII